MSDPRTDAFRVDPWLDRLGAAVAGRPGAWRRIGDLETRILAEAIAGIAIDRPIYISGLARSGSTILLELLSRHADTASHRYRDYPLLFTPVFWNRFLDRVPRRQAAAVERAHRDGIMVTPESPEAFEEVLWMAFFPCLHDPGVSGVLDDRTDHPAFAAFYRDHIRKLLWLRGGRRYLSKGNYNVSRLEYLLTLFPDARLVVPVRAPAWHIASLMKQHALFCDGARRFPAARRHLRRVGHFEFGPDRRPINVGDAAAVAAIGEAWRRGAEVEGWARYWSMIHGHLADRLDASPALRDAVLVVRFEDLCRSPHERIAAILDHCGLPADARFTSALAETVRAPTYYAPRFSADDLRTIGDLTAATAARFGYPASEAA